MESDMIAKVNKELRVNSTIRSCKLKAVLKDGRLIVIGKVRSYFQKQIAIHIAQKCSSQTFAIQTEIVVD